jgi:hypothetical protein
MPQTVNDSSGEWLGREAAAAHLNMAVATFDRLVRQGKIRKYHAAGLRKPLYNRTELNELVRPAQQVEQGNTRSDNSG